MGDDKFLVTRTRADAAERASTAWRMRVAGHGWDEIARTLGMRGGAPAAHRAVSRYFGRVPQPDRELLREVARQRTEMLWLRAAEQVDETPTPATIRAAVTVLERAAKLDGLDAPSRVEVAPENAEFVALIEAAARGMGLSTPAEADIFDAEYFDAEIVEDERSS